MLRRPIFAACSGYLTVAALLFCAVSAPAQQQVQQPNPPQDPASLPARDLHQKVLIAVTPLTKAEAYKSQFGSSQIYDAGILALDAYFRNDNDQPVHVTLNSIQLLVSEPGAAAQRLNSLSPEDVADIVVPSNPDPRRRRFPIPLEGRSSGKGKKWDHLAQSVRDAGFRTDLLPPHETVHGFFFFDINHRFDLLPQAHFSVPDLAFMSSNRALLFFEVDLAPALH